MKILLSLTFFSLMIFASQAQSNEYEKTMRKHVQMLDTMESPATIQELATNFERISNTEKEEWLPAYYAALCYTNLARRAGQENAKKADEMLDISEKYVAIAKDRGGDESEMMTLEGFIAQMRIMADPMSRGLKYGSIVYEKLSLAMSIDEDNPRPLLLMGINMMYTPEQFGGGPSKAKPYLEKAVTLYEKEDTSTLAPHWGGESATSMIKECEQKLGE